MKFLRSLPVSRKWLILPPMVLGIAIVGVALGMRRIPQQQPIREQARPLTVATVQERQIKPKIIGYGLAGPARVWRAVARVDGEVMETHPHLDAGSLLTQGSVLIRIDPTDYQLQVDQLQAEIDSLQAQIKQTETSRENDQAMLETEQQSLALAQKKLERDQRLYRTRASSAERLEQTRRDVLNQKRTVQQLQNSLKLIPAQLDQLKANLRATRSRLDRAKRDLQWTVIRAPFHCRLARVHIEQGQYVAPKEQLFEVHGVDAVEVEARLPIDDLRKMVPVQTTSEKQGRTVIDVVRGLSATVRVRSGDYLQQWPGELVRIREQVDRRTRTLGVVVQVRHQGNSEQVGHPPLLEGTFCEVELTGRPRADQLLVPTAAVRNGQVFLVNDQNRLERRRVKTVFVANGGIVVEGKLQQGDLVVIGDPSPAVEGRLVRPVRRSTGSEWDPTKARRRAP